MSSRIALCLCLLAPLAGSAAPNTLNTCKDLRCIQQVIAADTNGALTFDDCKALDGQTPPKASKDDFGMLCRASMARKKASTRKGAPCRNDKDGNPDWDSELADDLHVELYHRMLLQPIATRLGVKDLQNNSGSAGTNYGTYVNDVEFFGNEPTLSLAVFYCIDAARPRYVPYFYAARVGAKISEMSYVENVPGNGTVIDQLGPSEAKPEWFKLVDVNGDKHDDFVMLQKDVIEGVAPAACVYQAKGPNCELVTADKFMKTDGFVDFDVTVPSKDVLSVILSKNGQKLDTARYRRQGNKLVRQK